MPGSSYVALLRGINVGGKNKLPMKSLAALFAEAGAAEVRTYIQSGNVVFRAPAAAARRVPGLIEAAILDGFGLRVPVVLRSGAELKKVASANPFLAGGVEPDRLHVAFLASTPAKKNAAALDPDRSPPDAFVVRGREIYLHLPNGVGKSKLTNAYFDAKLETTSTIRNWRTVLELLRMTG